MNQIHLLNDELISQIAAGEVIERPASAVKELVENSVDAGSDFISIELMDGGLKKIRVVDNGCGMSPDDARMAFLRHATSKIASLDDLFSIKSLGFRGEALASIASVSRVTMKTRRSDDGVGTLVTIDGSKEEACEETACNAGTDITVLGLFSHTPARKKYMKSESTEYGHCFDLICQIAMAHPGVGFKLLKDDGVVFDLPKNQDLKERVRSLYGGEVAASLIPVSYDQSNLKISGFVGKPELSRSTKKYQFLFVNGRAIENRFISHAVLEAFHSLLMHEKYPWYALSISIDPWFLDVNVHPRKLEVKFVNSQEVYRAVLGAVHHALEGGNLGPVINSGENKSTTNFAANTRMDFSDPTQKEIYARATPPDATSACAENSLNCEKEKLFSVKGVLLRPIAQIAASYILAESEEGLVIIDQHAAHERVRYEKFMESMKDLVPLKQPLLVPLQVDLGADGVRLLKNYGKDFESLGYEVEPFGGSTFLIRSVPSGLQNRNPEKIFLELLSDLSADLKNNSVKNVREALIVMASCRGAVKFGDKLTMPEMQALIADMEKTSNSTHCPHGRPSIITLTFDKLEEMFKRKNF